MDTTEAIETVTGDSANRTASQLYFERLAHGWVLDAYSRMCMPASDRHLKIRAQKGALPEVSGAGNGRKNSRRKKRE